MENNYPIEVYNKLGELYPNACCELKYRNVYELTVATILSAQTTDKAVNNVTGELFSKYPNPYLLKDANIDDVISIIKPIGLSKTKASNIIILSKELVDRFNGEVPSDFESLVTLPGVGRKTANVILAEGFNLPGLAVDTHVARVSHRLGLTKATDPIKIEEDLKRLYPSNTWGLVHLRLLFFGRYLCKAQNPLCEECPFKNKCEKK